MIWIHLHVFPGSFQKRLGALIPSIIVSTSNIQNVALNILFHAKEPGILEEVANSRGR